MSDTQMVTGNTQTVTGVPPPTLYHRWLGWHALAMRPVVAVLAVGLIAGLLPQSRHLVTGRLWPLGRVEVT